MSEQKECRQADDLAAGANVTFDWARTSNICVYFSIESAHLSSVVVCPERGNDERINAMEKDLRDGRYRDYPTRAQKQDAHL